MRDHIDLGPTPCEEACAQIGDDNYHERAIAECKRYIECIRKVVGHEPEGAELAVKGFRHDFGTYYEVVCYFDSEHAPAIDYAFKCEEEAPTRWV